MLVGSTIGPFAFLPLNLHNLRVKLTFSIIVLSLLAAAQEPIDLRRNVGIDCSTFENAVGCKSYDEMFIANDKDLIGSFDEGEAYVCFPEYSDEFFVVAFSAPISRDFPPLVKGVKGPSIFPGYVLFKSYRGGVSDDLKSITGNWQKWSEDTVAFQGDNKNASSTVLDSEVSIDISFANVAGGTTSHSFQVRRSTLRFSDTMRWNNPPKKPKAEPDNGSATQSGHCKLFSKPKPS